MRRPSHGIVAVFGGWWRLGGRAGHGLLARAGSVSIQKSYFRNHQPENGNDFSRKEHKDRKNKEL
jgi:hypothetical protein